MLRRVRCKVQTTCSRPRERNPFRDAPLPSLGPPGAADPMHVPCAFIRHFRPRWFQERSRCLQDAVRAPEDAPRTLQELSGCAQDAPRASKRPKMPRRAPRCLQNKTRDLENIKISIGKTMKIARSAKRCQELSRRAPDGLKSTQDAAKTAT